ncbi:MAG: hypothetical protein JXX28_20025 [Deltaproteobacteria bacterium]|nr:hypothetical protein [Deltaproteobacteria bacterium]
MKWTLLALALMGCETGVKDGPQTTAFPPDLPMFAPTAVIGAPEVIWQQERTLLDGSASFDPFGAALTAWRWSCEDGTTASGPQVEVFLSGEGVVSCSLAVETEDGRVGSTSTGLPVGVRDTAQWTVLVFLAGDNDLETNAVEDFNEMELAGSTDEVKVVVQIDRSRRYSSEDGDWSGSRRYLVERDTAPNVMASPVLAELGSLDSGSPDTVEDFVRWGVEAYPAAHYALVMWDHGEGWTRRSAEDGTKSFSIDEGSGNDISVVDGELEQILATAAEVTGGKLDLVGFDACLMGGWEIAHVTAPYANTFVASQATEGVDGWAWDTLLSGLIADPSMSAADLGVIIAESFMEESDWGSTLSVTDLTRLSTLDAALDQLANTAISEGLEAEVLAAMDEGTDFEWGWGDDHDLLTALGKVEQRVSNAPVRDASVEVLNALDEVVLFADGDGEYKGVGGLSIFSPGGSRWDSDYLDGSWCDDSSWDELVQGAAR